MLANKHILLIVGGGIAAFKSLDLVRRLRERGAQVTPVLTKAGAEFVTPLSLSALSASKLYQELLQDKNQPKGLSISDLNLVAMDDGRFKYRWVARQKTVKMQTLSGLKVVKSSKTQSQMMEQRNLQLVYYQ